MEKAKLIYEKSDKLVEKQEKDRYKVGQIVEGGRIMRAIDKDAVINRNNVKIAQKDQRVGDEEAVDKSRYKCNEVYRDKITSGEMSIRYERGVDKDTVRNRNNVDLTHDVDKDAVKNVGKRQDKNHLNRNKIKSNKKGIRDGRGVDKDTAKGRYNVDLTQGFNKDTVQVNDTDETSVKRQLASS